MIIAIFLVRKIWQSFTSRTYAQPYELNDRLLPTWRFDEIKYVRDSIEKRNFH
jgi:hypothetical protein